MEKNNPDHPFSFASRDHFTSRLRSQHFDVVIIGGGITGAGIALDAASRGMKVALVEKDDFASGTSSRSTKLIHGGLRYLRQFQVHIVAETGRERKIVHRLAPHLIVPEKMILPIMKGAPEGKWMISFGLWMYDLLAGVRGEDRKKMLSRQQTISLEPLLDSNRLKGSGFYAEYMTDDARLTIEVIKTAVRKGAVCINYVEAEEFLYNEGHVSGIHCKDTISGESFDLSGEYVVNATGPWVDNLRKKDGSLTHKHLFITKGVHLVLAREKLPVHHSLYFEIPDGRMIFVIPRGDKTYVGTTDTPYTDDKNHVIADDEDRDYLLNALKYLFPSCNINEDDILSSWAGLRPLIFEEGKSASEISRKDEVFVSPSGLISMAGGKLTGYRKMARKVVGKIKHTMKPEARRHLVRSDTKNIPLTEDGFADVKEAHDYEELLKERIVPTGLTDRIASHLTLLYGKQAEDILSIMSGIQEDDPGKRLILAELDYCLDHEMVVRPLDFLERRSSRLYFMNDTVRDYARAVIERMATRFHWDTSRIDRERKLVDERYNQVTGQ